MKVLHDFFPATVLAVPAGAVEDFTTLSTLERAPEGGRFVERTRVVVLTDDQNRRQIMVAADHHSGPRLIFHERLSNFNWSGDRKVDSQALTESGKIIVFRYVQGCNCGSRLRSWSPYRTMDSIKDPTQ
jgi:hypothetical protein